MKEDAKKSKVKDAAAKATDSVSSARNSSGATVTSTAASMFARVPNFTSSVVGVAIRSGYKLIIIMPYLLIQ